jgi:folate-binding protein YgfZ
MKVFCFFFAKKKVFLPRRTQLPSMTKTAHLPARCVLAVTGTDRVAFLNGLVSNDVADAAPGRAVWSALLTAQGKWLADFFILADQDRLLLDCEASQAPMLTQRLSRYRLRADVAIAPSSLNVFAAWDGVPPGTDGIAAPDPRLPAAGWRILAADLPITSDAAAWDAHRLALGLPDGSRDMESEKSVLLEAGFDELHGISWTKGCYMGQELTARTRYRGLVKRRLLPVHGNADLPPSGTPVMHQDREVGVMRSSLGGHGLALLRLDAIAADGLLAAGQTIQPRVPDWAVLTDAA